MNMKSCGRMILTEKNLKTRRKICPIATLSTTNPTWTDLGVKLGLQAERPVTNHLSQGMVSTKSLIGTWPEYEAVT
jgi:hypothetical protein